MVLICNLSEVLGTELVDEDLQGHEVKLIWLNAQPQAGLH